MPTPVIDTHAHIVPPEMYKALRRNSARYDVTFTGSDDKPIVQLAGSDYVLLTHLDQRIETMDRQGVDMQVLTGWVDFTAYTMPLYLGIKFSELQNETIAEVVASNPGRYAGAANVPLQDANSAIEVMHQIWLPRRTDRHLSRAQALPRRPPLDPFWAAA